MVVVFLDLGFLMLYRGGFEVSLGQLITQSAAALILLLLLVHSASTAWIALVAMGGVAATKAFYEPACDGPLGRLLATVVRA